MTTATQARRTHARRRAAPERGTPNQHTITEDDKAAARAQLPTAFALLGLAAEKRPLCPLCRRPDALSISPARGTWACHRCRGRKGTDARGRDLAQGDAIDLLLRFGSYTFPEAIDALLGRPTKARPRAKPVEVTIVDEAHFEATIDPEVYDAVLDEGSSAAAQGYYGRFHISSGAVIENRAVVVERPPAALRRLTERFGRDRLVQAGLIKDRGERATGNRWYPMLNTDYPVVEPHLGPDNKPRGLQFRASGAQERKIRAHKDYSAQLGRALAEAGWDDERLAGLDYVERRELEDKLCPGRVKYVPKFLSLVGGNRGLVGCGIPRIASLSTRSEIFLVEGFKDLLAARTMGVEAYAIPGVGVPPPPKVCRILAEHATYVVVSLDGDDAGLEASDGLGAYLEANGVPWRPRKQPLPRGMDVTDVLVERHSRDGCDCQTG